MTDRQDNAVRDRFGEIAAAVGALLYLAVIVLFVWPLARWIDTLVFFSLLFVPAIVGGLIYARIERSGGWDQSKHLK